MFGSVSLNTDKTSSVARLAVDAVTKHTNTEPDLSFPPRSVASEELLHHSPNLSHLIYFYELRSWSEMETIKVGDGAGKDCVKRGVREVYKERRSELWGGKWRHKY